VHDKDDTISVLEMNGTGAQMLADFRKELRDTIFTLVLGANLPTNASEGGSFALASIQENSTEALLQFDRESLEETMTDRLLGCVWAKNHRNLWELGLADEKPRFNITQEKILDPEVRGRVIQMAVQNGLPVAKLEAYEQLGLRKPEDEEETLAPVAAMGGGDIFGGLDLGASIGEPGIGAPGIEATTPDLQPQEIQDTALNGAQVTAAADIIIQVVNNQMPPVTAKLMLTSMFSLPAAEANAMVDEAVAFQPAAPVAAPAVPVAP
jgi:hypothetical protein